MTTGDTTPQAPPTDAPPDPVLVIEDDPRLARAMELLVAQAGRRSQVFHTGRAALDYAGQHPAAAAVIDIHLPDISGLALTQELRRHLGAAKPIIVVSGDTSIANLNSLATVGATYFFGKPFRPGPFVARLRDLLA